MKLVKMFINRRVDKENGMWLYDGVLLFIYWEREMDLEIIMLSEIG